MNDGRLTIKDIARLSGVGISTVSRVVNNRPDVSEDTRRRVMAVVERESYAPNGNAKHLKQMSSDAVAVIIRGMNNMFFVGLLEQLQHYFEETGLHYLSYYIDERDDEINTAKNIFTERKVRGIIFLGGSLIGREAEVATIPVPCVFATMNAQEVSLTNVYSVCVDDRKAAKEAVDSLFAAGHKKIAVIGGALEGRNSIGLRYQGALDSFIEHGAELDPSLYLTSTFSFLSAYEAVKRAAGIDYTAVFAMSDIMAIGAVKALRDEGKRVPDDVSVIGYDGLELAKYYNPTLTTMRQPQSEIAKASVRLLMCGIEGRECEHHITLLTELVHGNSVKRLI